MTSPAARADLNGIGRCGQRAKHGDRQRLLRARLVSCFFDGADVVMTHGFTKKTDKVAAKELARGRRIRTEYLQSKDR